MDIQFLTGTRLFQGASPEEIREILRFLNAQSRQYTKGEAIFRAGDQTRAMGLILSGSVNIENDDAWGNKTLLDNITPGQVFGETYACIAEEPLMVNAVAAEDSEILFLSVRDILETNSTCACYGKLVRNLLTITARKNLNLSRRIFYTSSKTIRGRLLSYLSDQAVRQGSSQFSIPFNRQQLADYLGVDRSALSNELSKMRREGLLAVRKNVFQLMGGDLFYETR